MDAGQGVYSKLSNERTHTMTRREKATLKVYAKEIERLESLLAKSKPPVASDPERADLEDLLFACWKVSRWD